MELIDDADGFARLTDGWRGGGASVGFHPTMGALHAGHAANLRLARGQSDRLAASIFVNPLQFGPSEDFDRYPRPLEADLALCEREGADAVWAPTTDQMYPPGLALLEPDPGPVGTTFEGAARPGHFAGVLTVVHRLLDVAGRCRAYFGEKDAQQCAVVRRLAEDLDTGTEIVVCPTVRDADGLALSSRNVHLSAAERAQALAIPEGLAAAARSLAAGERGGRALAAAASTVIASAPDLVVEYVAVVDPDTFEPVERVTGRARILVAARIGATRLIDTLCLGVADPPTTAFIVGGTSTDPAQVASTGRSRTCSVPS